MTWCDFWAYGWAPLTVLVLVLDRWHLRRTKRRYFERWGVPYDGP